jgi:hypothetical protein
MTTTPTALLQARLSDIIDELLRRGFSIEELCQQTGLASQEEWWTLLGVRK